MIQPIIIPISYQGQEAYQLCEPWKFAAKDYLVTVPEGFVMDGASVPRLLWPFMPPDGLHRGAAMAHDWIYANKGLVSDTLLDRVRFSRAEADLVFYTLMVEAGISRCRAGIAYRGVRMGGWLPWSKPSADPTVIPVRNAFFRFRPKTRLTRHLYDTIE